MWNGASPLPFQSTHFQNEGKFGVHLCHVAAMLPLFYRISGIYFEFPIIRYINRLCQVDICEKKPNKRISFIRPDCRLFDEYSIYFFEIYQMESILLSQVLTNMK